jgi:hypothetical protein
VNPSVTKTSWWLNPLLKLKLLIRNGVQLYLFLDFGYFKQQCFKQYCLNILVAIQHLKLLFHNAKYFYNIPTTAKKLFHNNTWHIQNTWYPAEFNLLLITISKIKLSQYTIQRPCSTKPSGIWLKNRKFYNLFFWQMH